MMTLSSHPLRSMPKSHLSADVPKKAGCRNTKDTNTFQYKVSMIQSSILPVCQMHSCRTHTYSQTDKTRAACPYQQATKLESGVEQHRSDHTIHTHTHRQTFLLGNRE